MLCFDFVAQSHTPPRRAAAAAAPQPPSRRPPQPRHQADCGYSFNAYLSLIEKDSSVAVGWLQTVLEVFATTWGQAGVVAVSGGSTEFR